MTLILALQILSYIVGTASTGYKLVSMWEKDHPGSRLTKEQIAELKAKDAAAHEAIISHPGWVDPWGSPTEGL